jgi:hypothetical protein
VIKITNEVDGKKYELVKAIRGDRCDGCAMKGKSIDECRALSLLWGYGVCARLNGIWKEIKDEKTN